MKNTYINKNKYINDFLNYYINLKSPQYAVMLKGKWGSGKTYFINEYTKTLNDKQKYIYVSLYGVKSYDEIETKFFAALHPKLSGKTTVLAGGIVRGLLKDYLKININIKDSRNLLSSCYYYFCKMVNCFLKEKFKIKSEKKDFTNTQDHLLIFDDLERCSIPINDILGYINYFVEHQNYKVIILANEKELDKDNKTYNSIKEKLIGKTFELSSNVEDAFGIFVKSLETTKPLIKEYEKEIINIYKQSKSDNLRTLRQTLSDFEIFYKIILVNHKEKKELIADMLKLYFIFSFENNIFDMTSNNDKKEKARENKPFNLTGKSDIDIYENGVKSINKKYGIAINKKYGIDIYENIIFDILEWKNIIYYKSLINKDKLNELLKDSKYYIDDSSPNWRKLWNFIRLDDSCFKKVLKDVEAELKNLKLKNIFEVRHINALLIYLIKNGLYNNQKESKIYEYSKKHIKYLHDNHSIDRTIYEDYEHKMSDHFNETGLRYYDENNKYCKKFIKYLNSILKKGKKDLIKKDANSITTSWDNDFDKTKNLFTKYSNIAFLHHINIKNMVDTLYKVNNDNDNFFNFGKIIRDRYSENHITEQLTIEKDFLQKFIKAITKEQKKYKGTVKGYNIDYFIKKISI